MDLRKLEDELHNLTLKAEVCPHCPGNVILEAIERPRIMYCPVCGCSRSTIDITSAVDDKETPIPFRYRGLNYYNAKRHFETHLLSLINSPMNSS
jgi:hypothetical protein